MALIRTNGAPLSADLIPANSYIELNRSGATVKTYTDSTSFTVTGEYAAEVIANVKGKNTVTASITAGDANIYGIANGTVSSIASGGSVSGYDYIIVLGSSGTTHTLTVTIA